jgi:hypothetical protein
LGGVAVDVAEGRGSGALGTVLTTCGLAETT